MKIALAPHGQLTSVTKYTLAKSARGGISLSLLEGESSPLWWISGGGSFVIESRYVALIRRSDTAPTNPGQLTVATGLSDGPAEWENPLYLMRELFEELLVFKDGAQVVPSGDLAEYAPVAMSACAALGLKCPVKPESFAPMQNFHHDEVETESGTVTGVLSIDPHTARVNLMWPIAVSGAMTDMHLLDGELADGIPLRRPVYFYDLKTSRVLDQELKEILDAPRMTYHAERLIQALTPQ